MNSTISTVHSMLWTSNGAHLNLVWSVMVQPQPILENEYTLEYTKQRAIAAAKMLGKKIPIK